MIHQERALEEARPELEALFAGSGPQSKPRTRGRRWPAVAALLAASAAGVGFWMMRSGDAPVPYGTAQAARQTITRSISATGTIQPVITVQVGTQVSGTISELYADYNSQVKKGEVIARLDPSQFNAQLAQANGTYLSAQAAAQAAQNNVVSADAGVASAQANVDRTDAALVDGQKSYNRTRALVEAKVGPAMDLETAQSTLDQAAAQKQQAVAQLNQARAQAQSFAVPGGPGTGAGQPGQSRGGPGAGQPGPHDHPRADRWRGGGAQRGCGPDRGGQPAGAGDLSDRQRPDPHAGAGQHR